MFSIVPPVEVAKHSEWPAVSSCPSQEVQSLLRLLYQLIGAEGPGEILADVHSWASKARHLVTPFKMTCFFMFAIHHVKEIKTSFMKTRSKKEQSNSLLKKKLYLT